MYFHKKQQGIGLIGWILTIFIIACFAALVAKLAPVYMENYMVKRILESVQEQAPRLKMDVNSNPNLAVRDFLLQRFQVNNIQHVGANNINVTTIQNGLNVRVVYEVRTPMIGNVDAVLRFDNAVQVPLQ